MDFVHTLAYVVVFHFLHVQLLIDSFQPFLVLQDKLVVSELFVK